MLFRSRWYAHAICHPLFSSDSCTFQLVKVAAKAPFDLEGQWDVVVLEKPQILGRDLTRVSMRKPDQVPVCGKVGNLERDPTRLSVSKELTLMTQAEVPLRQRKAVGRLLKRREAPTSGCALLGGTTEKGGE